MKLTTKKIEEILVTIITPDGLPLIKELQSKDNISEFDLASKTKKDIKVIRKQLYILYNHNLVSFTRKKDKVKGWYIYYWTLVPESVRFSYFKMKRELVQKLEQQLEEENRELFFVCKTNCTRLNFDQAMDFEFRCPECGELIHQDDSQKRIADIETQMRDAKAEIVQLQEVRKEHRKIVKEKKKERKVKQKVRKEAKKVNDKKTIKKQVKKTNKKPLKKK